MPVVAFDVVDKHIRPARGHDGSLNPSHPVSGQERCGVAPEIIVGEAHGYAIIISFTPGIVPATVADGYPAVSTELMFRMQAATRSIAYHIFRLTK